MARDAKTKRRYFLHAEVKKFAKIDVRKRQVDVTDEFVRNLSDKQSAYILELLSLGYNIQYNVPH